MFNLEIDANDWEGHRRLSLALAMRRENEKTISEITRRVGVKLRELWDIVAAPPYGWVIGTALLILALAATVDIWASKVAVNASSSSFAAYAMPHETKLRTSPVRPAMNASMVAAASPF